MARSTVFPSVNSPGNCDISHSVLPVLILPYWSCYLIVIQGEKNPTVLNRLHISNCYLTHSFILRREEAPVCVAGGAVITVKHILFECCGRLERNISKRDLCIHSFGT